MFMPSLRYTEFSDLRKNLLMTFPNGHGAMPPLPPKSVICKQHGLLQEVSNFDDRVRQVPVKFPGEEESWTSLFLEVCAVPRDPQMLANHPEAVFSSTLTSLLHR